MLVENYCCRAGNMTVTVSTSGCKWEFGQKERQLIYGSLKQFALPFVVVKGHVDR